MLGDKRELRLVWMICAVALSALGGCRGSKPAPATRPAAELAEILRVRRLAPQPIPTTLLAEGQLPLIYQFGMGGPVKVYDATQREQVWSGVIEPDTIIVVDNGGVMVRGKRVFYLRLDPRRRYELWYEPGL